MKPLSFLSVLFLLCGCVQKLPPSPSSNVPPTTTPQPTVSTPVQPRTFDESILSGHEFLLEAAQSRKAAIRDIVLGDWIVDPELSKTLALFFRQVNEGNLDETLLEGRWSEYLKAWAVAYQGGFDVQSLRMGPAQEESPSVLNVPVRILTKGKEYRGWISLIRQSKELLVSDVQIQASDPPSMPFDPEAQAQEISSPIRR